MLLAEITDHKDTQVCTQINEKYLEYFNELNALYRQSAGKPITDNLEKCSLYTWLWSKKKEDLCKRTILKLAFDEICLKMEIEQLQVVRLWEKLKIEYGNRDTYPKPYLGLTDSEFQNLCTAFNESKPHIFYLAAQNEIFKLCNSKNYPEAIAMLDHIHTMCPHFET